MLIKEYRCHQTGYMLIGMLFVLFAVAGILATKTLKSTEAKTQKAGTSQQKALTTIQDALVAFASVNKRLPCPADGSLSSGNLGIEVRKADGTCTSTDNAVTNQKTGIVPWRTLGIKESEALSIDFTYFSYRVFSGTKGASIDNGIDMTLCDTDNGVTPDAALSFASGQCTDVAHNSTSAQFIANKGLTVKTGSGDVMAAYVLIHHGANGDGAYLAGGSRNSLPLDSTTKEYANIQGTDGTTATYYATSPDTAVSVADGNTNYFDDRVSFLTITDLAKKAGLAARNWPETGDILDAQTLADAGFKLNTRSQEFSSVTIGNAVYTVSGGGTVITTNATDTGIGVGTLSGSRSISGSDSLSILYATPVQKFSIILSQLGMKTSGGSAGEFESAKLELWNGGTLVDTVYTPSCGVSNDTATNIIAFDNITTTTPFTKVVLKPGGADATYASATNTNFYLNGIAPCASSTSGCIPAGAMYTQLCPYSP